MLGVLGTHLGTAAFTAGYLFTYWNSKAVKEREAQIDRVNAQVRPCPPARLAGAQCLTLTPNHKP